MPTGGVAVAIVSVALCFGASSCGGAQRGGDAQRDYRNVAELQKAVKPRVPRLIAPYYPVAKHGGVASVTCFPNTEAHEVSSYTDEFASREELERTNNFKKGERFFDCEADFRDYEAFRLTVIVGRGGESWRPIRVG